MKRFIKLIGAAALVMTCAVEASTKPCSTGSTTNSTGQKSAGDKSSAVDPNYTKNVTPIIKEEHPGTVGAMDKVGANQAIAPGEARPVEGKVVKQGSDDC
ncbi:hypothetical protein [Methylobacterium komagatae]